MEMPKLLIADTAEEFRQALAQMLCSTFTVRTCRSGGEALELLHTFQPDIFLTDLVLPQIDGISLLQQADQAGLHPKILVMIGVQTPYILGALNRLQVDYVMMKPCDLQALNCRIQDLAADLTPSPVATPDPRSLVCDILLAMGFSPKLDGYCYLHDAIPIYAKDPHQAITKELYTAVGDLHGKDPKLVERSIRSAIDSAWRQRDDKIWRGYVRTAPDGTIPRPTNGDLIASLAHAVTVQVKQPSCM